MELLVMAAILAAVLIGQYFLYQRQGQKRLNYTLTLKRSDSAEIAAGTGIILEAFEDEELELIEEIDNAKPLPLPWVRTEISCSRWLTFHGCRDTNAKDDGQKGLISGIFTLRGRQKCRRTWRIKCEKRGVFTIDDVSVTVSDLFGLVRNSRVIKLDQQLRILPIPAEIEPVEMSGDAFIGDIPVRRFVLPDPFVISGAREYTGREPMNRIHWAQSARSGSLMVYCNEFTTERRVMILLNIQRSYHGEKQQMSLPTMEALIKGAAFTLEQCAESHTECALAVNSPQPVPPVTGEGYEHRMNALRELAELSGECGEHIDDFISGLNFNDFTDVVFISSFLDDKCADVLRELSGRGVCISIMSTEIENTDICEVQHIHKKNYR